MKTLIVYYSATGNNKALAEDIAKRLDADVEEIAGGGSMEGMGVAIAALKALIGLGAKVGKPKYDPSAYDLVVLVSPVYAGGVPAQMGSYLKDVKGKIRNAAIASVSGSGNNPKAMEKIEKLAEKKALAILELKAIEDKSGKKNVFPKLTAQDLEKPEYAERIDGFVRTVQKGSP